MESQEDHRHAMTSEQDTELTGPQIAASALLILDENRAAAVLRHINGKAIGIIHNKGR